MTRDSIDDTKILQKLPISCILMLLQFTVHTVCHTTISFLCTLFRSNRSSRDSILIYDSDVLQQQQSALKVEDNPEVCLKVVNFSSVILSYKY